ncbi:hypothetical protein EYF80_011904 [Liparis tanakae]|uniref:Uncharacterized protein n=1 Tax=Liparis tanakae TaxID=230148 RepID=A0A4Z2IJ71_9TELE|nr:hypothetical protein EYF80_011904 [Liparis tanakae]
MFHQQVHGRSPAQQAGSIAKETKPMRSALEEEAGPLGRSLVLWKAQSTTLSGTDMSLAISRHIWLPLLLLLTDTCIGGKSPKRVREETEKDH